MESPALKRADSMTLESKNSNLVTRSVLALGLLAAVLGVTLWQPSFVPAKPSSAGKREQKATACGRKLPARRHAKKKPRRCKSRSRNLQITFTPSGTPEKKTEPTPAGESARVLQPSGHSSPPPPKPAPVEEPAPPTEQPPDEVAEPPPSEPPPPVEEAPDEAVPTPAPFRFFSPSSFWNSPVPADAETDPNSGQIAGAFESTIAAEL